LLGGSFFTVGVRSAVSGESCPEVADANGITGGIAQTLGVAGAGNDVGDVLDALFADAHERGAVAVQGRVEPHLLDRLPERRALFHKSGYLPLIHSPRPELLHAIHSGRALLTRVAGEWWMGHHLLPFDSEAGSTGS